jgi:hypothetical protein
VKLRAQNPRHKKSKKSKLKHIKNSNVIEMKQKKRSLKLVKDFATAKLKKEGDASQ